MKMPKVITRGHVQSTCILCDYPTTTRPTHYILGLDMPISHVPAVPFDGVDSLSWFWEFVNFGQDS